MGVQGGVPGVDSERRKKFPALYARKSQGAIMEERELESYEQEPGPGAYFGPESSGFSSLGNQRFSGKRTECSVKIAKTGWTEWDGVFISKAHRPANAGAGVPGPGLYGSLTDEGVNTPCGSTLAGDTGVTITKAQRFRAPRLKGVSPGPAYDIRDRHVKDGTTKIRGLTSAPFGKGNRFMADRLAAQKPNVGPGAYENHNKDVAIKVNFATGKSFGLGYEAYRRVICPGWEKVGLGVNSKGPGEPLWSDVLDTKKPGVHAIPKAKRWMRTRSQDVPGPGQYKREERDMAKCNSFMADTPNPTGIKFGKPSVKPRFRQQLMLRCPNGWGYF